MGPQALHFLRSCKIKRTAATAFDKQLLIAQGAASDEDVAARMVGKQVEEKKEQEKQDEGCIELQLVLCWCPLNFQPFNVGQFDLCNCYCFFLSVGQRVLRNSFVSDHDQRQTDKAKTRIVDNGSGSVFQST